MNSENYATVHHTQNCYTTLKLNFNATLHHILSIHIPSNINNDAIYTDLFIFYAIPSPVKKLFSFGRFFCVCARAKKQDLFGVFYLFRLSDLVWHCSGESVCNLTIHWLSYSFSALTLRRIQRTTFHIQRVLLLLLLKSTYVCRLLYYTVSSARFRFIVRVWDIVFSA